MNRDTPVSTPLGERLLLALCLAIAVAPLLSSAANALIWDDVYFWNLSDRPDLGELLCSTFWGGSEQLSQRLSDFWRPLTSIVLWISGGLFGDWGGGYHLVSALCSLFAAGSLLALLLRLLPGEDGRRAAPWLALLFLAHPLNAEMMLLVVNLADYLVLGFLLLQIRLLLPPSRERRGALALAGTALCAALACAAKELGALAAAAPLAAWALSRDRGDDIPARSLLGPLPWAASALPVIAVLAARQAVIASAGGDPWSSGVSSFSWEVPLLAWGDALRSMLLPLPRGAHVYVNAEQIAPWVLGAAAWCGLIALVVWRAAGRRRPTTGVAGLLLALALLLPSLLAVDLSEGAWRLPTRYYAPPLAGLLIAIAPLASRRWQSGARIAAPVAVVLLASLSWVRISQGRDNVTFFAAEAGYHPESLFDLYNLAEFQCESRRFEQARRTLKRIEAHPRAGSPQVRALLLGSRAKLALLADGDLERATRLLEQSLRLEPSDLTHVLMLAEARARAGRPDQSAAILRRALQAPWFADERAETIRRHLRRYAADEDTER
ncbi:MAG: hypothetical protein R6V85_01185 [Polyangia bacterium]